MGIGKKNLATFDYPAEPTMSERQLLEIRDRCHLPHLSTELDQSYNWSQALLLGEQQRIAFARVLLQSPVYLCSDQATASLDERMEEPLHQLVRSQLRNTTVISVGHRSTLVAWHESLLTLRGDVGWRLPCL